MRRLLPAFRPFIVAALAATMAFSACPALAADRVPNDTYYKELWYLTRIGAPEAWNRTLGFEGVTIAIIDTGVDIDHPDLKDNIWHNYKEIPNNGIDDDGNGYVDDFNGWNFVDNNNDPRPSLSGDYDSISVSHGTVNASVAAARGDNGRGVVGVTWQSTIMALRALGSDGSGDPNDVVRAVEYAVANGAKVISLSFNGPVKSDLLASALRRAYDAGVFVVAAAGNAPDGGAAVDLDKEMLYPVCLDQGSDENFVYGVAATDEKDMKASFSNYGAGCVDISAPGTRVLAAKLYRPGNNDFSEPYGGYYNGTSVAAPMVAGAAALLKSLDRNLTPKQIGIMLGQASFPLDNLNPGYFGKLGRGRLDIAKAVNTLVAQKKETAAAPTATALLMPSSTDRRLIVAASGPGRAAEVRLFMADGTFVRGFYAFGALFRGGASVATGNFDGNGRFSIVVGAGPGGGPHVRVFDINTRPIGGFFAFDQNFRGGVSVAAGDTDGDGRDEIIVGAGPGGGPHVRVFEADGTPVGGFFAFDQKFRGGVSVAAGDTDGDGRDEIVTLSGSGTVTTARIFRSDGRLVREFRPFGNANRRSGELAVGDTDGDGRDEIAVSNQVGAISWFEADGKTAGQTVAGSAFVRLADNTVRQPLFAVSGSAGLLPFVKAGLVGRDPITFYAFEKSFRGGVRVAFTE
ncbi:MAG: S8 family serine peptidase [Patescibacteria group bacterium]|nr:S8 family serine peptidase [Patescibacteria group bacterium]